MDSQQMHLKSKWEVSKLYKSVWHRAKTTSSYTHALLKMTIPSRGLEGVATASSNCTKVLNTQQCRMLAIWTNMNGSYTVAERKEGGLMKLSHQRLSGQVQPFPINWSIVCIVCNAGLAFQRSRDYKCSKLWLQNGHANAEDADGTRHDKASKNKPPTWPETLSTNLLLRFHCKTFPPQPKPIGSAYVT